jgi:uncharacterized sporulation protein YeaH/YhbH (DUF444 family)
MPLAGYLETCRDNMTMYATATERLLAAIGGPMVDMAVGDRIEIHDACLWRIFGGASEGSSDGEGQDDFRFALSRDKFVELFLEDLEPPDLVKRRVVSESDPESGCPNTANSTLFAKMRVYDGEILKETDLSTRPLRRMVRSVLSETRAYQARNRTTPSDERAAG